VVIISSMVVAGLVFAYKAPENTSYFIKDLINRKNISAVALGSSSVISLPLDTFEHCPGLVRRGFGGGTLDDLLFYLNFNLLPDSLKLILVYAGENDIVYGKTVDQTISQFKILSSRLAKNFPEAELVILKIKLSPGRSSYHSKMRDLNNSLKLLENDAGVTVVGSELSDYVLPELYLADGIHLVRQGYEVFLKEVTKEC